MWKLKRHCRVHRRLYDAQWNISMNLWTFYWTYAVVSFILVSKYTRAASVTAETVGKAFSIKHMTCLVLTLNTLLHRYDLITADRRQHRLHYLGHMEVDKSIFFTILYRRKSDSTSNRIKPHSVCDGQVYFAQLITSRARSIPCMWS